MLFVAGESSIVYGFSLETHEIIDIWNVIFNKFIFQTKFSQVGENITAMDTINFEDGGTVWAVGCANGKIFLRSRLLTGIINQCMV